MSTKIHPAVQSAAHQLAEAEAREKVAAQALAKAEAERGQIDHRSAALHAKRSDIIAAARQDGQNTQQQALELAVIDADLEDLTKLAVEADAVVTAAHGQHAAAQNALSAARHQFQRAEDEAAEMALVKHAERLDALMLETVQQLAALGKRLGRSRPAWGPGPQLRDELRRIQLLRGTL